MMHKLKRSAGKSREPKNPFNGMVVLLEDGAEVPDGKAVKLMIFCPDKMATLTLNLKSADGCGRKCEEETVIATMGWDDLEPFLINGMLFVFKSGSGVSGFLLDGLAALDRMLGQTHERLLRN